MFAEKLKTIMLDRKMTLSDLSRATGINKSSISQYMSGKNVPSVERMGIIADALGVSIDEFIVRMEPELTEEGNRVVYNLNTRLAARLMGTGINFIQTGLQEGIFPWGYAVKTSSKWTYYINSFKFSEHEGIKIPI